MPTEMTMRDRIAAAALTGLLANGDYSMESTPGLAWGMAGAMLRERERTNHDAAPAARASVESVAPQPTTRGDSDRTDKAAPRPSEGTGDTPATHATRGEGSERRECTEPVAWAVMPANSDYCVTLSARREAAQKAAERKVEVGEYATMDDIVVVPLYRQPQPTLTDAERGALEQAATVADVACEEAKRWVGVPRWANGGVDDSSWQHVADSNAARAATLRGLLERLG